jgi:hypothetical protein
MRKLIIHSFSLLAQVVGWTIVPIGVHPMATPVTKSHSLLKYVTKQVRDSE